MDGSQAPRAGFPDPAGVIGSADKAAPADGIESDGKALADGKVLREDEILLTLR